MKSKLKDFFSQYGPISGILVVLLIVVFSVNVATGFGPGGEFAPGGEHDVSKQEDASSDSSTSDSSTSFNNDNLVGSGDATINNGDGSEVPLGGSTQTVTPGNEDGSGSIGFNPDGSINPDTLPPGVGPQPDVNPNLPSQSDVDPNTGLEIEPSVVPPSNSNGNE